MPRIKVASEFVKYSSRRNCIDLTGIRLLVSQVLQRRGKCSSNALLALHARGFALLVLSCPSKKLKSWIGDLLTCAALPV